MKFLFSHLFFNPNRHAESVFIQARLYTDSFLCPSFFSNDKKPAKLSYIVLLLLDKLVLHLLFSTFVHILRSQISYCTLSLFIGLQLFCFNVFNLMLILFLFIICLKFYLFSLSTSIKSTCLFTK